jgi:antitoxin component HigA of HigAB toxin-antitoxin module
MTPTEYRAALYLAHELMGRDPEPESPEGLRLIELVRSIEAYEEKIYPVARVLPELAGNRL